MKKNNEIRHGRHCKFLVHVHLVFVTKYRRNVFTKEILNELKPIFSSVCKDFAGSCGGAPISVIRQYIEQQQTPD
ncbi:MAG: transposase [Verrucomicrobiota bacterium]|nr:transposase [Verrucomicrobiota bacterium]